jgi:hypothetical protein
MAAVVAGAALAAAAAWWANLQAIDGAIQTTRSTIKKLTLSGGVVPNQEVMDYLSARGQSLEARYNRWLALVTSPPPAEAASADPQLYFQERFHEVQRTLERLATARGLPVPEQLGFPKELPPSDTVTRLLIQLSLIEETAALMLEQPVTALSSFKVEDPEPVPEEDDGGTLAVRLPVRVRLSCSLAQLLKILGTIQRIRPVVDVRALRIQPVASAEQPPPGGAGAGILEAEMVLARYLLAPQAPHPPADEAAARRPRRGRSRREAAEPSTKAPVTGRGDDPSTRAPVASRESSLGIVPSERPSTGSGRSSRAGPRDERSESRDE